MNDTKDPLSFFFFFFYQMKIWDYQKMMEETLLVTSLRLTLCIWSDDDNDSDGDADDEDGDEDDEDDIWWWCYQLM